MHLHQHALQPVDRKQIKLVCAGRKLAGQVDFARNPAALRAARALQRQHPLLCKGIMLAIIGDELPQKVLSAEMPAAIPDGQDLPMRANPDTELLCLQQKLRGFLRLLFAKLDGNGMGSGPPCKPADEEYALHRAVRVPRHRHNAEGGKPRRLHPQAGYITHRARIQGELGGDNIGMLRARQRQHFALWPRIQLLLHHPCGELQRLFLPLHIEHGRGQAEMRGG